MAIFSTVQSRMQYYREQSYSLRSQAAEREASGDWDEASRLRKLADDAENQALSLESEIQDQQNQE